MLRTPQSTPLPTRWRHTSPGPIRAQSNELIAPDGEQDDKLALSVAMSGSSCAIGVPGERPSMPADNQGYNLASTQATVTGLSPAADLQGVARQ